MDMSERKLQILQAIIMNYLETAEPVGSRTISRRFLTDFSSATIRNEMSDLEEMGLIEQPHTSAGRIPSAKGYRLYVDQLMQRPMMDETQALAVRDILKAKSRQLDSLLREIGDLLAAMTKYTAVVTMPPLKRVQLKHIQLVPLDESSAMLILVTDGNIVRNHLITLTAPISPQEMERVSQVLNQTLSGLAVSEMDLPLIQKIKHDCGIDPSIMENLLDAINDTMRSVDDTEVFTSGATNILNFPEFSDISKARSLLEFLNQKEQAKSIGEMSGEPELGVQITIGTENQAEELKDCSIVTANYRYNGTTIGSISVVGPMRMDYNKVVSALENLMKDFPQLFSLPKAENAPIKLIEEDKDDG